MIKYRNTYRIIDDICYIDCYKHDALEARKEGEIKYFKYFRYDDKIC